MTEEPKIRLRCTNCGQLAAELSAGQFMRGSGPLHCACQDRVLCEGCDTWFDDDMAWFLHLPECPGLQS